MSAICDAEEQHWITQDKYRYQLRDVAAATTTRPAQPVKRARLCNTNQYCCDDEYIYPAAEPSPTGWSGQTVTWVDATRETNHFRLRACATLVLAATTRGRTETQRVTEELAFDEEDAWVTPHGSKAFTARTPAQLPTDVARTLTGKIAEAQRHLVFVIYRSRRDVHLRTAQNQSEKGSRHRRGCVCNGHVPRSSAQSA